MKRGCTFVTSIWNGFCHPNGATIALLISSPGILRTAKLSSILILSSAPPTILSACGILTDLPKNGYNGHLREHIEASMCLKCLGQRQSLFVDALKRFRMSVKFDITYTIRMGLRTQFGETQSHREKGNTPAIINRSVLPCTQERSDPRHRAFPIIPTRIREMRKSFQTMFSFPLHLSIGLSWPKTWWKNRCEFLGYNAVG
jgi:hypothetical protein